MKEERTFSEEEPGTSNLVASSQLSLGTRSEVLGTKLLLASEKRNVGIRKLSLRKNQHILEESKKNL